MYDVKKELKKIINEYVRSSDFLDDGEIDIIEIGIDNPRKAIRLINKLLKTEIDDRMRHNLLLSKSYQLEGLEKFKKALKVINRAIQFKAFSIEALNNKGLILKELNQAEQSIKCFDEVISADPHMLSAWKNKIDILLNLNKEEDAIKCFGEMLRFNPDYSEKFNKDRIPKQNKFNIERVHMQTINSAP